ncbi:sulfite exporter TauE/SafE family protein [Egicoccus halophilus]|uniref:sulfite exporter TauE/SafE family protein n=1 Tax=Egicoccus halophilus TaxID=1670830 RepID=UPI0010324022|nr:sulfite exporter TauE/SafE family protein [Egicoccus halophilus]
MTLLDAAVILLAGLGAGAMNAVVGAGTLITFPTLLALGFPPVVANVSNTVGLVPGGVAAAYGFRATLTGRARLVLRLAVASAVGGVIGGALLLVLPSEAFEVVIPPLLLLSAVLAAAQPRVATWVTARRERRELAERAADDPDAVQVDDAPASDLPSAHVPVHDAPVAPGPVEIRLGPALYTIVFLTGIYGGYFGAAQGVILLAVLGSFVAGGMPQVNGIKNVLAGIANLVSAVLFIAVADVDWRVAGLVALGATVGGLLGSRYGRRLPARPLRALVVLVALSAAVWQFVT